MICIINNFAALAFLGALAKIYLGSTLNFLSSGSSGLNFENSSSARAHNEWARPEPLLHLVNDSLKQAFD